MAYRARANERHAPISVYEVHASSWRRGADVVLVADRPDDGPQGLPVTWVSPLRAGTIAGLSIAATTVLVAEACAVLLGLL